MTRSRQESTAAAKRGCPLAGAAHGMVALCVLVATSCAGSSGVDAPMSADGAAPDGSSDSGALDDAAADAAPDIDDSPGVAVDAALETELPCGVQQVLQRRCHACHGSTLLSGAPMPLLEALDFEAAAPSDPNRRVYELTAERLYDRSRPMPPRVLLPADELVLLDAWLDADRPLVPPGETCELALDAGGDEPDEEWPADCEQHHTLRAHAPGDPSQPYRTSADQPDSYVCWYFDRPWPGDRQLLELRAIFDEVSVLHHPAQLLLARELPRAAGSTELCPDLPADVVPLASWPEDGERIALPDGVGFDLGSDSASGLILRIHYYANGRVATDASGVELCTTSHSRPESASISMLGTRAIELPPGTATEVSGTCRPSSSNTIRLIRVAPFMRSFGRQMTLSIVRASGEVDLLFDHGFVHDATTGYELHAELRPGDELRTACSYENYRDRPVGFGLTPADEACFAFVTASPADALRDGREPGNRCMGE